MGPATQDTLLRIASMTKAFTALTILACATTVSSILMRWRERMFPSYSWKYPTTDSLRIRVRDRLNHTAGFVTDGLRSDRQTPIPEPAFSQRFGYRGLNA